MARNRAVEAKERGNVIRELERLRDRPRKSTTNESDDARLIAEFHTMRRGGADHDDFVPGIAQSAHQAVDMDGLAVLRADAMVVENLHVRGVAQAAPAGSIIRADRE